MTEEEYRELGRYIWKNFVPKSGQSDTVQGELLRANEKLRDEAHRNGNGNWDNGHELLANFIKGTLSESSDLSWLQKRRLRADIEILLNYDEPYLKDDLFDRIEKAILDWYVKNRDPIPREHNPNLHR